MANIGGAQGVVASIGVDFRAAWHQLASSVRGSAVTVVFDCAPCNYRRIKWLSARWR